MSEALKATPDVVLAVKGMTCGGCANAVTRVVKRLDPGAEVSVDLDNARVNARTSADPHGLGRSDHQGGLRGRAAGVREGAT